MPSPFSLFAAINLPSKTVLFHDKPCLFVFLKMGKQKP